MSLRLASMAATALALVWAPSAAAVVITVDPGDVRTISDGRIDMDVPDLSGIPFDGQTLEVDFLFAGDKFVRVQQLPSDAVYQVALYLEHGQLALYFSPGYDSYLSDGGGSEIVLPRTYGQGVSGGGLSVNVYFPASAIVGIAHYGVHWSVTLPDVPGVELGTGNRLLLRGVVPGQGRVDVGELVVGATGAEVPEPGTFALLGVGLSLLLRRRSRVSRAS